MTRTHEWHRAVPGKGGPGWASGSISLPWGWPNTATGFLARFWMCQTCVQEAFGQCPQYCAFTSGWLWSGQAVGLGGLSGSLATEQFFYFFFLAPMYLLVWRIWLFFAYLVSSTPKPKNNSSTTKWKQYTDLQAVFNSIAIHVWCVMSRTHLHGWNNIFNTFLELYLAKRISKLTLFQQVCQGISG